MLQTTADTRREADHATHRAQDTTQGRLFQRSTGRGVLIPCQLLDRRLYQLFRAFFCHRPRSGFTHGAPRAGTQLSYELVPGLLANAEAHEALDTTQVLDRAYGQGATVLGEGVIHPCVALFVADLAQRRESSHCCLRQRVVQRTRRIEHLRNTKTGRTKFQCACRCEERQPVTNSFRQSQAGLVDHVLKGVDPGRVAELHVVRVARQRVVPVP